FEGKYIILKLQKPLDEVAKEMKLPEADFMKKYDEVRKKLLDKRSGRDRPMTNKIALTAWSGLMIAGYAEAARAFEEPKYLATAKKSADFLLSQQKTKEGRLLRTYG